jgi:hypothetical protein
MEESFRVRRNELEWREVEGEIVLLDLRRSLYLAINPSGAALWPRLVEGATRPQLTSVLVDTFGLDTAAAERDVDEFLGDLEQAELLERDP